MNAIKSQINTNYKIEIFYEYNKDGSVNLKGKVRDNHTGKYLKSAHAVRKANSKSSVSFYEVALIEELEKMIPQEKKSVVKGAKIRKEIIDDNSNIVKACRQAFEDGIVGEYGIWRPGTSCKVESRFYNVFIPRIIKYEGADTVPNTVIEEIREQLIDDYYKSGHTLADKANAESNAEKTIAQFEKVWNTARNYAEYIDYLPKVDFPARPKRPRIKKEQIKMLSSEIFSNFLRSAMLLVDSNPKLALCIWIIIAAGCRVSEAVAITPNKITDNGEFVVLEVSQQEFKGKILPLPKTDYSYRRIPVVGLGAEMIRKSLTEIKKREIEISNKEPLLLGRKVSFHIKRGLIEAGLNTSEINYIESEIRKNPEHDCFRQADLSAAAHVLRRNIASVWKNYCGCTCLEIDYLLGHKRPLTGIGSFAINDPNNYLTLCEKLKCCDLRFFVDKKSNPFELVIDSEKNRMIPLTRDLKITSKGKYIIKFVLFNAEMGGTIKMKTNGKIIKLDSIDLGNNYFRRKNTEMIGKPSDLDEMEKKL